MHHIDFTKGVVESGISSVIVLLNPFSLQFVAATAGCGLDFVFIDTVRPRLPRHLHVVHPHTYACLTGAYSHRESHPLVDVQRV